MSKAKEVYVFEDLETEVMAFVTPGCKARGPSYASGGEPEEPHLVEDLYVGVLIKGESIDITKLLSKKQLAYMEAKILERAEDLDYI